MSLSKKVPPCLGLVQPLGQIPEELGIFFLAAEIDQRQGVRGKLGEGQLLCAFLKQPLIGSDRKVNFNFSSPPHLLN